MCHVLSPLTRRFPPQNLADESKRYKWSAKKLSMMALFKQWAAIIAVVGTGLIMLLFRYAFS